MGQARRGECIGHPLVARAQRAVAAFGEKISFKVRLRRQVRSPVIGESSENMGDQGLSPGAVHIEWQAVWIVGGRIDGDHSEGCVIETRQCAQRKSGRG